MAEDPRFEYLEGRVEEQSRNWDRLFEHVGRIDQKIDLVAVALSARIDRSDEKLQDRCDALEAKLDARCDTLDRKVDDLRSELSKQFRWTMGVMVTLATGVLTAVLTR